MESDRWIDVLDGA